MRASCPVVLAFLWACSSSTGAPAEAGATGSDQTAADSGQGESAADAGADPTSSETGSGSGLDGGNTRGTGAGERPDAGGARTDGGTDAGSDAGNAAGSDAGGPASCGALAELIVDAQQDQRDCSSGQGCQASYNALCGAEADFDAGCYLPMAVGAGAAALSDLEDTYLASCPPGADCDCASAPPAVCLDGACELVWDSCHLIEDSGVCDGRDDCVWTVPGCGDDENLPAAGCYPDVNCFDAPCPVGYLCQPDTLINPCWNSPCLACGAYIEFCLPVF